MRGCAEAADVPAETMAAANEQSSALSRLLVVVENYPTLKATQNFLSLQDQLEGTENRISVARNDYTVSVRDFNTRVRTFPRNLIAGMFGFTAATLLEATESAEERKAPKVSFK